MEKLDFSVTIDFYDLKSGTCCLLSDYMKTYKYLSGQDHCLAIVRDHLYSETFVPTLA